MTTDEMRKLQEIIFRILEQYLPKDIAKQLTDDILYEIEKEQES